LAIKNGYPLKSGNFFLTRDKLAKLRFSDLLIGKRENDD